MMKKLTALAATLLLTLGVLLLCTSCGGVKELSVDTEHLPQTVFVAGNELDLSAGSLLADGKAVPLTDPEVTVTGYDKDTVGKQTLTITYKGAETTLDITVAPRFETAEKYLYFVGETIDAVGVRLRVTRDNGTNFSVSVGDEGVEVTGFTTAAATDALTLNIACRNEGTDYTGSFAVMVADPAVSFKNPRKTSYGSHETTIDPTGASLTLKSADGKTTRNISSDTLTFAGYDPSLATETEPSVTETVRVLWHGREMATFTVTVNYSDVSRVKAAANTLSAIDWSHYDYPKDGKMYVPEGVTDADGKLAMRTLELYYSLTSKDADFILPAELDSIARLAVIYGYNEFYAAIKRAYADVFVLGLDSGSVYLEYTCEDIDTARAGLAKLLAAEDEDTKLIYRYGNLLKNEKLSQKCGETVIYKGAEMDGQAVDLAVGHLMTILYDSSFFTKIEHVLEKMIAIPALLDVPVDWAADTLSEYVDAIEAVYTKFVEISLSDATDGGIYGIVNSWREKQDIFEILYRYYYGVMKDTDETVASTAAKKLNKLVDFYLPGRLEELRFTVLSAALVQEQMRTAAQQVQQYGQLPSLMESTMFFSFYHETTGIIADLVAEDDEMYLFLYASVFAQSVLSLQVGSYGYYALQGTSAFDEACIAILKEYRSIWEECGKTKGYENSEEFSARVDAMFRAFVALRQTQQRNILSAINYLYGSVEFWALYPSEDGLYSKFASYIYATYVSALGLRLTEKEIDGEKVLVYDDPAYDLFLNLMGATESFANGIYSNFYHFMTDAENLYSSLTAEKKSLFDGKLGFLYTSCHEKFSHLTVTTEGEGKVYTTFNGVTPDEEWQAVFDSLSNELTRISWAKMFIEELSEITGQSIPMYLAYLASYERVLRYEEQILSSGNADALTYYYHYSSYTEKEKENVSPSFSLSERVYDARGDYQRYLLLLGVDEKEYEERSTALRTFLAKYADYLWTAANSMGALDPLTETQAFSMDAASLKAMFADFRALSADEKYLMLKLDSLNLYYGGLEAHFASLWKSSHPTLSARASALLAAELAYFSYEASPDGTVTDKDGNVMTTKEYALSVWEAFNMADSLDSEEAALFNPYFEEMENTYRSIFSALSAEPDAEG